MKIAETLALARPEEPPNEREALVAVAIAGGLYFVGGLSCASAALLPSVNSPAGVIAVALEALVIAGLLLLGAGRGRGGLGLAWIAELWGVVVICVLCASSGGSDSPFAMLYFFALCHAAAFQPRSRVAVVAVAALVAFLAPLVYQAHVSSMFGAVACVGIMLALLASLVVHTALNRLRLQRRRMEILNEATAKLDRSLDPAQTLRTIAHTAVPDLAELCVIDLLDENGAIGSTVAAAVDPAVAAGVERMRRDFPLDMDGGHPVAQVLGGAPRAIRDLTETGAIEQAAQSDEHRQFMREAGYTRAAVFPLVARGRTRGAISFLQLHGDASRDLSLLTVLEDLAGRAAMAFDNARLYAERAQVARTLRSSVMPARLPEVSGLELASYFRPSDARSEVGGDFYDVFRGGESCWLVVGDVCGKGAEAAALTSFVRHTTAAYARESDSPGSVLSQVNQAMLEHDFDGRFATAVLARIHFGVARVEATVALAGHPAALVVRGDGRSAHELGDRGSLLGIFSDASIEDSTTVLEPGDGLALYTDGLPEAHAPARLISTQAMIERLQAGPRTSAKDSIDALLSLVNPDDSVRDDIAILSARMRPARV